MDCNRPVEEINVYSSLSRFAIWEVRYIRVPFILWSGGLEVTCLPLMSEVPGSIPGRADMMLGLGNFSQSFDFPDLVEVS